MNERYEDIGLGGELERRVDFLRSVKAAQAAGAAIPGTAEHALMEPGSTSHRPAPGILEYTLETLQHLTSTVERLSRRVADVERRLEQEGSGPAPAEREEA